jgi:hypothetical protein
MQQNKPISSTDQAIAGAVRAVMARRKVSQSKLWGLIYPQTSWSRSALNRRIQGDLALTLGDVAVIAAALEADPTQIVSEVLAEQPWIETQELVGSVAA